MNRYRLVITTIVVGTCLSCAAITKPPASTPPVASTAEPTDTLPAYFEFQVEKPAGPVLGNKGPTYPKELRAAGTTGQVLAQFVIDTSGRASMTTFKVLKSDHQLFTEAVRTFIAEAHFTPAELHGRKVRQLAQQPFNFFIVK
jgi:TonB family protein